MRLFFVFILFLWGSTGYSQLMRDSVSLAFRHGSEVLSDTFSNNSKALRSVITENQQQEVALRSGQVRLSVSDAENIPEPESVPVQEPLPEPITTYPIAIRTNLLYDIVGVFNIGVEVPFGQTKTWSWIADFAYAYWHSPNNMYALKTLNYGTELRYWFGVNDAKKRDNGNWAKPLKGWNMGVYGHYWQQAGAQWVDGYQADDIWSAGLTAGYSFPIGKALSLEFSLGAGWLSVGEYRHYHQPQEDYLMWQETGVWSGFSLTKVQFSLVWLIEGSKKGGMKQ